MMLITAVLETVQMDNVLTCDFATLLALEDQMSRERFEQIKVERPDFAEWLDARRSRDR